MQYENAKQQLKIDKKALEDEKCTGVSTRMTDVIRLNVGGEVIVTKRQSLTPASTSVLAKLCNGRWKERMPHDEETNLFLDFNPLLFRHLLEQLRQSKRNPSLRFTPPRSSPPFAMRSYKRMLTALGLDRSLSSTNEIVVMNVGGDRILTRQKTLNLSRSTALILLPSTEIETNELAVDADPWLFRHFIGQLREQKTMNCHYLRALSSQKTEAMDRMLRNFGLNRKLQIHYQLIVTRELAMMPD